MPLPAPGSLPLPTSPPKHVGIVGVSPEGTGLFYRELYRRIEQRSGEHGVTLPRVTLHNEPLPVYLDAVDRNDWQTVGQLLAHSAKVLAQCGAELAVLPDNLMQFGLQLAEVGSTIPWVKMTDAVADAVVADGRGSVGIIGTRLVMEGSTYQTLLGIKGIKVIAPQPDDAEMIDRVIFDELVHGEVNPISLTLWQRAIGRLAARGAQGIILANTEAPMLIGPAQIELPMYDSLTLLVDACINRAYSVLPQPA